MAEAVEELVLRVMDADTFRNDDLGRVVVPVGERLRGALRAMAAATPLEHEATSVAAGSKGLYMASGWFPVGDPRKGGAKQSVGKGELELEFALYAGFYRGLS